MDVPKDCLDLERLEDDYEHLDHVGSGKFGKVFKVRSRQAGKIYAAKHIECRRQSQRKRVWDEVSILRGLEHSALLQLVEVYQDYDNIVQILEYLDGGDILGRILSTSSSIVLTEQHMAGFIQQILAGLEYLHSKQIVHLDIKPENIVFVDKLSFKLKIVDFGLARRLGEEPLYVMEGTPDFLSPEVVEYQPVDTSSDMWAVGVVTYVILSGLSPFLGDSNLETFNNITNLLYTFQEEEFEPISECGKDFISKLLQLKPCERLTAKQALVHPWIREQGRNQRSDWKLKSENLRRIVARNRWGGSVAAIQACIKLNQAK